MGVIRHQRLLDAWAGLLAKSTTMTFQVIIRNVVPTLSVDSKPISVGEGAIFCIMGLSGSGKSTLVRHINRLDKLTE